MNLSQDNILIIDFKKVYCTKNKSNETIVLLDDDSNYGDSEENIFVIDKIAEKLFYKINGKSTIKEIIENISSEENISNVTQFEKDSLNFFEVLVKNKIAQIDS